MTTFVYVSLVIVALAAVLLLGGCASSKPQRVSMGATSAGEGYTCPLTGEQLPCPKCCPLNKNK
ncbi:MAG: hypothetical protein L0Y44_15485 [Phycisphaerales bacterium]|nr:hypothetical protein [Phycisphaerales bacterium]MCI0632047.1 hypothetical protein [Phycisphaerales bacterium]